jgi:YesN/AraC family two-component response regulator
MQLNYDLDKSIHSFQQISEPHFHDGYEILLCLSDGGKFHIQENAYPLCRGMMFVLPPKVAHRCIVDIASYERYILHFSAETLWMLSSSKTDIRTLFDSCNYYTVLSETQFENLSAILEKCREETADFGSDLEKYILFMHSILLIGRILHSDTPKSAPSPSKEFSKILPLMEYIHEHYDEDLTLDMLSQKFFISKYYLCHQFKDLTGFSVGNYLSNYRIRQACSLLRAGISVQAAGERVGFKNNTHFIRCFGQIIGVSPGKYVKSLQYS